MKHLLLALLLAITASSALADTPEAILKDYRKQAQQAVARLNQSLEKTATPLITKLVSSGDTAGAELLTSQLKVKLAGDAVSAPQASAVQLFALYDEARAKALAPLQKSSIARIDSLLKTAGGAKIETIAELGKVRAEIEAGNVSSEFNWKRTWVLHYETKSGPTNGKVVFNADGSAIHTSQIGNKAVGTWKLANKANSIRVLLPLDEWLVTSKQTGVEVQIKTRAGPAFLVPDE